MIALRIEDIRQFTAKLFVGETFDHFLIKEAEIVTFNVSYPPGVLFRRGAGGESDGRTVFLEDDPAILFFTD